MRKSNAQPPKRKIRNAFYAFFGVTGVTFFDVTVFFLSRPSRSKIRNGLIINLIKVTFFLMKIVLSYLKVLSI